jgi:hypothetical protein
LISRGDAEAQRISPAQRREEENLVSRVRGIGGEKIIKITERTQFFGSMIAA